MKRIIAIFALAVIALTGVAQAQQAPRTVKYDDAVELWLPGFQAPVILPAELPESAPVVAYHVGASESMAIVTIDYGYPRNCPERVYVVYVKHSNGDVSGGELEGVCYLMDSQVTPNRNGGFDVRGDGRPYTVRRPN